MELTLARLLNNLEHDKFNTGTHAPKNNLQNNKNLTKKQTLFIFLLYVILIYISITR